MEHVRHPTSTSKVDQTVEMTHTPDCTCYLNVCTLEAKEHEGASLGHVLHLVFIPRWYALS